MRTTSPRKPAPWLRAVEESVPAGRHPRRPLTAGEKAIAALVTLAIIAMAIWFLFLATGGPGFGTV